MGGYAARKANLPATEIGLAIARSGTQNQNRLSAGVFALAFTGREGRGRRATPSRFIVERQMNKGAVRRSPALLTGAS